MATKWHLIKDEWETTNIQLTDLAAKHGLSVNTVRSRKAREGWERDGSLETTPTAIVKQAAKQAIKERIEVLKPEVVVNIEPIHKGEAKNYARPVKNAPWLKYLPEDVVELMKSMEETNPIDILYDQIRMQWAMIIRAQEIMYVADQLDTDRFKTKSSMESDTYEVHTAWDKHGKFMSTMAAAQKELRYLIQQFMELAPVEDERRARIKNIEVNTELAEQRVKALKGATKDTAMLDVLINAVTGGQPQ